MNNCNFTGRITKDPEIKYTQNGAAYLQFTIAVNRTQKDTNGNYVADFVPCTAWQQRADFISRFVKKGNMLSIVGQFQTRSYKDQQGNNRVAIEILVDQVENLSPRENQEQRNSSATQQQQTNTYQGYNNPQYGQQPAYNTGIASDDDVPF